MDFDDSRALSIIIVHVYKCVNAIMMKVHSTFQWFSLCISLMFSNHVVESTLLFVHYYSRWLSIDACWFSCYTIMANDWYTSWFVISDLIALISSSSSLGLWVRKFAAENFRKCIQIFQEICALPMSLFPSAALQFVLWKSMFLTKHSPTFLCFNFVHYVQKTCITSY